MSATGNPYADTHAMYIVHNMLRREFGLLPGLVRSVSAKDEERVRIVADHITLLCGFLHHHHSAEDEVLWPLLLARAPKEIDPVVHLVEGHHKNIEALIADVERRLGTWSVSGDNEDGVVLAHILQRLAAALYEHMGLEERLVLPLAERHVFATEWEQMQAQAESAITPENGPLVAGMVMYEGGAEILPEEMLAVVAEMAPSVYAAYCERVHGTPTPPRSTDLVLGVPFFGIASQDGEFVR